MEPRTCPSSRADWRSWLQANHDRHKEVWLVFWKKHTGKAGIAYREAVEEALCFGWIDGLKRSIDDQRYAYRFTPRRPRSRWSPLNIRLAQELIAAGKMTPAGQRAFERGRPYDESVNAARRAGDISLDPEFERALRADGQAWRNFQAMAPGYRRQYAGWLNSAKRPETRRKRLKQALERLRENRKPGMK
jgi:uncharacterized protein YdeI (YjbR/CyaY-like superfamily)